MNCRGQPTLGSRAALQLARRRTPALTSSTLVYVAQYHIPTANCFLRRAQDNMTWRTVVENDCSINSQHKRLCRLPVFLSSAQNNLKY